MDHNRDTHARSHAQMSLSQARTPDAPRQVWGKGQPQPCADIWTWAWTWVWAVSKLVVALQPSEQSHTYVAVHYIQPLCKAAQQERHWDAHS